MEKHELEKNLLTAIKASVNAGDKILEVYNSEFAIQHKEDRSPLTKADEQAHLEIVKNLSKTGLNILSEEGKEIPYEKRKDWEYFWMVDPLDGTKEFIKRNGEFTVNIALVHKNRPIAGIIYVPVKEVLYLGAKGIGAYKIEEVKHQVLQLDHLTDLIVQADKLPMLKSSPKYTAVGSRSHMSKETEDYFESLKKEHGEINIVSMGSSLKICLVAEGTADVYPRFAPTMEWDTAAGQAIAEAAGKQLLDYKTGNPMHYNRQNLRNDWFIVK